MSITFPMTKAFLRGSKHLFYSHAVRYKASADVLTWRSYCSSSSSSFPPLPEGWERVTRKNGAIVYYNHSLRRTVKRIPGYDHSPEPEPIIQKNEEKHAVSATSKPQEVHVSEYLPGGGEMDVVTTPIDFDKAISIEGLESQVAHVELEPNQRLRAETGSFIYMTEGVEMETSTAGGWQQGLKRIMTGENFFVSHFTYHGNSKGRVGLGTSFPSKILRLRLNDFGGSIICQRGAFLCGSDTVNIEMEFAKKFGVGFFGGQGFILQRLTGHGDALVKASGAVIEKILQPGEVLRISSGSIVAFEPTIHYDITMLKGVKNVVFGGEGLFLTKLTGPGKVILHSLPYDRMIGEIASRIPSGGRGGFPIFVGGGGDGSGGAGGGAGAGAVVDEAMNGDDLDVDSSLSKENDIYGGANTSEASSPDADESTSEGIMDFFDSLFRKD